MRSFVALSIATAVSAVHMKSQQATQVSANLNYFTQLLEEKKVHVCDYTQQRNKNPDQPIFDTVFESATAEEPFTDTLFPADESSLVWKDANETFDAANDVGGWKRISEVYGDGKYSLFGNEGVTPKDILQGSIGNCWFMSAISAIAEEPGRVEKMFLNTSNAIEPKGVYGVNMFALGVPITIIVDDQIPMYYDEWGETWLNLFAGIGTDDSVWGAIIEKAFAKFHGNYKHIVGGVGRMAVRTLVGGPFEDYWHNKDGEVVTSADDLWELLSKHDAAGQILQTSTSGNNHFHQHDNGLAKGHQYTTIGVTDLVPGKRLVKVRNPWGSENYKGAWCDSCAEWDSVSDDIKKELGFEKAKDGIFYITVEDYQTAFESTEVNYDVSGNDWFGDYYLFLNDVSLMDADSGFCEGCTKHEFTLTNTSEEKQKVYAAVHTWDDRQYSYDDKGCDFKYNYVQFDIPGDDSYYAFGGTQQVITEMEPGAVIKGVVELAWNDDQAQDWSITTWAKKGKVKVALTSIPTRPSDTTIGYYAGEAPEASYEPIELPEGETPQKVFEEEEGDEWDDYEFVEGPDPNETEDFHRGWAEGQEAGYLDGLGDGYVEGISVNMEDIEWV